MWDFFKQLFTPESAWPFIVLLALLIYMKPISAFLISIGENLGRIRQVKIGENFTFSADEIIEVLVDREKLKIGVLIAMAEGGINDREAEHLARLAYPMKNDVQSLSKQQKIEVLEESINMALIDGKIQKQEYIRLKELADLYNQDKKSDDRIDLDDLIAKACYFSNGKPPEQLVKYYPHQVKQWEKEIPPA